MASFIEFLVEHAGVDYSIAAKSVVASKEVAEKLSAPTEKLRQKVLSASDLSKKRAHRNTYITWMNDVSRICEFFAACVDGSKKFADISSLKTSLKSSQELKSKLIHIVESALANVQNVGSKQHDRVMALSSNFRKTKPSAGAIKQKIEI